MTGSSSGSGWDISSFVCDRKHGSGEWLDQPGQLGDRFAVVLHPPLFSTWKNTAAGRHLRGGAPGLRRMAMSLVAGGGESALPDESFSGPSTTIHPVIRSFTLQAAGRKTLATGGPAAVERLTRARTLRGSGCGSSESRQPARAQLGCGRNLRCMPFARWIDPPHLTATCGAPASSGGLGRETRVGEFG